MSASAISILISLQAIWLPTKVHAFCDPRRIYSIKGKLQILKIEPGKIACTVDENHKAVENKFVEAKGCILTFKLEKRFKTNGMIRDPLPVYSEGKYCDRKVGEMVLVDTSSPCCLDHLRIITCKDDPVVAVGKLPDDRAALACATGLWPLN